MRKTSRIIEASMAEIAFVLAMMFLIGYTLEVIKNAKEQQPPSSPPVQPPPTPAPPSPTPAHVDTGPKMRRQTEELHSKIEQTIDRKTCRLSVGRGPVLILQNGISPTVSTPTCVNGRFVSTPNEPNHPLFEIADEDLTLVGQGCVADVCTTLFEHWRRNQDTVEAIEIVGHSSPDWQTVPKECKASRQGGDSSADRFLCNQELSMERAHSVWKHCLRQIPDVEKNYIAFAQAFKPTARSSLATETGGNDCVMPTTSRRVEFVLIGRIQRQPPSQPIAPSR